MPYSINRYNGTVLTTVEDGTIDNTLDIKLIGKNYAGYGEVQNENFVHLLENFSGNTAPPRPISGQIWFDLSTKKLKFNDGTKWRTTGGAEVASTPPSGLTTGDFWWDTDNYQLWAYGGTDKGFVLIGPQAVGTSITQMRSRSVEDTQSATHAIIEAVINDETIFVISADPVFTLKNTPDNQITGFSKIRQGITLVNTGDNKVTSSDHVVWGTATNSQTFGYYEAQNRGYVPEDFLKVGDFRFPSIESPMRFNDVGYTLGDSGFDDLAVFIDKTGGERVPTYRNSKDSKLKFQTLKQGTIRTPVVLYGDDILPGANNVSNIGSTDFRYANVYATTFNGTAISANYLNVGGNARLGSVSADISSVAVRGTDGSLTATSFKGTADQADKIRIVNTPNYVSASTSNSANTVVVRDDTGGISVFSASLGSIIRPAGLGTGDIGSQSQQFNNVWASSFSGVAASADQLKIGSSYYTTSSALPGVADKTSVVSRATDGSFAGTVLTLTRVVKAGTNGVGDIGQVDNKFDTVYANNFVGNFSGSFTGSVTDADRAKFLRVDGNENAYRAASTSATVNTIAARDSSGNLTANVFNGIATQARYADLAEKYLADADYEVGTVMVVGGSEEVTASSWGQRAIGVISANPAHLMNAELEGGVAVALKGRVPVKVAGAVKKGDRLVASNNGCAAAGVLHSGDVFAIALESNDNVDVKLVEAVIL